MGGGRAGGDEPWVGVCGHPIISELSNRSKTIQDLQNGGVLDWFGSPQI